MKECLMCKGELVNGDETTDYGDKGIVCLECYLTLLKGFVNQFKIVLMSKEFDEVI